MIKMKNVNKGINGCCLKLIAAATMLIDHIGFLLLGYGVLEVVPVSTQEYSKWYYVYYLMRCVGRVAFPIYAFLLTEGIAHTRSWKKYGLRLGTFALISEIPFNLVCCQKPICGETQNIFFTLLIGLLTVEAAEYAVGKLSGKKRTLAWVAIAAIGCMVAVLLRTDYDYTGVLLIVLLYLLRERRVEQCAAGFFWLSANAPRIGFLLGLAVSFLMIRFYNGERGSKRGKYFFYGFYPVHLLVLYLIYQWLMQNIGNL